MTSKQGMRYYALAVDYDGTLAKDGRVDAPTIEAIERLRVSGRKLLSSGLVPDRVAPGGFPPGAPTDPNVRN